MFDKIKSKNDAIYNGPKMDKRVSILYQGVPMG